MARLFSSLINIAASSTPKPARKSRPAIIFRLFPLSARIPPRGENKMEGIIEAGHTWTWQNPGSRFPEENWPVRL